MRRLRERWVGLHWRLRATRRLWGTGLTPSMPFLPPGKLAVGTHGIVDEPEPGDAIDREMVYIRGWALFPSGPAARVDLWIGEQPLGRARVGTRRADIEALTDDALAGVSGFELTADLRGLDLRRGETEVRAVATSTEGDRYELPPVGVKLFAEEGVEPASIAPPPARTPTSSRKGRPVLVCTHQLNLGGAQLYLMDLLREIARQETIAPTVVSALDGELREELEALGIPVHISGLLPLEDFSAHIGRVEELTAWAAGREFEAVFINTATAFSFPGGEVAAELGIPAIWAIHESFPPAILWGGLSPEVRDRAERTLSEASLAIFEADATRQMFEPLLGEGTGLVLPYGLDLEPIDEAHARIDRAAARREAGVPEDAEVVLCVGTIEPRKSQLSLAQAFSSIADRHPRAKLVFVGGRDDVHSEALSDFIEASGHDEQIELIPVTPDVQPWYALADMLVCASDIESLPRTVLEAMAFETPVLATSVFGLPELIDDGETGWLCEPRETMALATALDRALNSSQEERETIGRAARELVVRRHALDAYGRDVARLIEQAIAAKTPEGSNHATAG